MGAVVLLLTWACATGIITTASRMTWSFARDNGTPFSRIIAKVDRRTKVPIVAVGVVTGFACLLTLIYIGSYTAFNDVISLTITGFYGSYFLPSAFLLWHRIKGDVLPHGSLPDAGGDNDNSISNPDDAAAEKSQFPPDLSSGDRRVSIVAQPLLVWGPWHIPGLLGTINNAYACTYMIFVIFWSFWPPETPVTAETMNYSVVVTGGVIIFSIIWYFVRARKVYKGPLIDEEVKRVMRLGSVVVV